MIFYNLAIVVGTSGSVQRNSYACTLTGTSFSPVMMAPGFIGIFRRKVGSEVNVVMLIGSTLAASVFNGKCSLVVYFFQGCSSKLSH